MPSNTATQLVWHRISPIAILYFLVSLVKGIASQFVIFIPIFILMNEQFKKNPMAILIGAAVIGLLLIGSALLNFWLYRYRVGDDYIEIRSGVLNKKQTHIPFDRIQNIKLEQPVFYRLSQHCCMQLDTAGSSNQEAKLVAIKMEHAVDLKTIILSNHTASETEASTVDNSVDKIINTRSISDLVIHGLTNNRIWIFIAAVAPLVDNMSGRITNGLSYLGIDIKQLLSVDTQGYAVVAITVFIMALSIMALLALFSVFGSLITYYGYTLTRVGNRYVRQSGLLTKHEVALPLRRLQSIQYKQDWLDVILKRVNLTFKQNTSGPQQPNDIHNNSKLVVPSVYPKQAIALAQDAMPNTLLNLAKYNRIHPRYMIKANLLTGFPLALISLFVLLQILTTPTSVAVITALIILAVSGVLNFLRWRRWGFSSDRQFIYIRKGLIGVSYHCFEHHKLQQVKLNSSWLMQRRQLSNIQFILASGSLSIPYISEPEALLLADTCLYETESSGKNWM